MDEFDLMRQREALMAIRLYQVLDHLIQALVPNDEPDVQPGGYSEEIFTNLSDEDKEKYTCSIWYT